MKRESIIKASSAIAVRLVEQISPISGELARYFIDLEPNAIEKLMINIPRKKRLEKIASAKCEKKLLVPSAKNEYYEIYLDHRIDGDPYMTVVFPL